MKLDLSVSYDVDDPDPQAQAVLEEIVAEEARGLAERVRQRLAEAGVRDIAMTVAESDRS
jgi:hypothetical protein